MKDISIQAKNSMNLVGKLLNVEFGEGKMSDGREYKRANVTIRVTQPVDGKEETSEITVGAFASPFTSTGKPNPAYKSLVDLQGLKTAQNVGVDMADKVSITGGSLSENNFVSRSGNLINGFQIRASFFNPTIRPEDAATFITEIYVMDMHEETDREGEFTGRLIVRGGVVQYNGRLDVLDFVVEAPDKVEYISNNWAVNTTVTAKGRVRMTSQEVVGSTSGGWGEDISETTTAYVRELVITGGDDGPKDEEFGYDPAQIKKAFNDRKARIEQMTIDARSRTKNQGASVNPAQTPAATKYSWE